MTKTEKGILLTETEALIISKLLEMARDEFSNHGSNDLEQEFYSEMTKSDLIEMAAEFSRKEDFDGTPDEFLNGPMHNDCIMLSLMALKLKETVCEDG